MASFGTVTILGVGLIGGSIGGGLRACRGARRVVGVGRNRATLDEALRLGVLDHATTDLAEGVAEADVVVVCTPVTTIAAQAIAAARHAPAGALVTDAGSTKRSIVEAVEVDDRGRAAFVGAHPIAGSERSGVAHARPGLFAGRVCVVTPTAATPPAQLDRATAFWSLLGCRVVALDPAAHDEALALTSHLPHALAAALAATVPTEMLHLAAGAYRDVTRVAGADPALWGAIFRENRGPLLQALDRLEGQLAAFRQALEEARPAALEAWWEIGRKHREQFRFDRPAEPARRLAPEAD